VALGGVAHKPWRDPAAERLLPRGGKAVSEQLLANARTSHDNAFKPTLVQRTIDGLLLEARRG
jgi:xanthine dehydrogenase YagS FAD-binding subunit